MTAPTFDDLSPALRAALEGRGFTALTPVQEAVLDPALAGRDLRIFSRTGSGKTVAVGLAIAPDLERALAAPPPVVVPGETPKPRPQGSARPFALVIAPTRELAAQIAGELGWLFAPLKAEVTVVTGGASYPKELAALRRGPRVVVGTPGRLIDHLSRKSIDPSELAVVVLDEADQMLDMGFRDELLAILDQLPEARRTLLLSATFPREVQRLADRCQKNPIVAAGSDADERHTDITHVAHLVRAEEREGALRNLLLMAPGERALVFVRTREGAAELADQLSNAGLPARAIHGDLEQRDRTRTLDAFRSGVVTTLVATDVAARGIDVPDVTRVIHADPPGDAEVLTHRSGRTGRAGKKGTSVVLVPPGMRERVRSMLHRAGMEATWSAAPSASDVLRAADERLVSDLSTPREEGAEGDPRLRALAERLLAAVDPTDLVASLLARTAFAGACAPAEVTAILPPAYRTAQTSPPPARGAHGAARRGRAPGIGADGEPSGFVPFRITWGERHGADARRLLAIVCRRGGIRGTDVGAIRIGDITSTFEVAAPVAAGFTEAVKAPDARDPRIHIHPLATGPVAAGEQQRPPRVAGAPVVWRAPAENASPAAPVEASEGSAPPPDAPAERPARSPYAPKPHAAKAHPTKTHAAKTYGSKTHATAKMVPGKAPPAKPAKPHTPAGTAPPRRRIYQTD